MEFAEASHVHCLNPSFNVCCQCPRFTCIQKCRHDQEMLQSDFGADCDILSFHCSCGLGCPEEYFGLNPSSDTITPRYLKPWADTIAPRYLKLWAVTSFLLSMIVSVFMLLVLFVINWFFPVLICIPYAADASPSALPS